MRNREKDNFERGLLVFAVAVVVSFVVFLQVQTMQNGLNGPTPDGNGNCNLAYYCPGR